MEVNRIIIMANFLETIPRKVICYAWKYQECSQGRLSRDGESFKEFKKRMETIFPDSEDWYRQYSEWKEIF